jgi:hypothetical protein
MKKVFLSMIVLATMFACNAPEKKADAVTSGDPDAGSYVSLDDKTAKAKELIESYMKGDSSVAHELFVDTLKAYDGFAQNVDSLNNIKVSPGGRSAFITADMYTHTIFSDITMSLKPGDLKTFTSTDGKVATGYWGMWTGKGKYTNMETKVPLHMVLWWKDGKIVSIYRMFDPSTLKAEVAASQKK